MRTKCWPEAVVVEVVVVVCVGGNVGVSVVSVGVAAVLGRLRLGTGDSILGALNVVSS